MEVLRTENIRKIYQTPSGEVRALDGVSVSVEEGEFVADAADTVINEIDGHYLNTPCFKGSAAAREAAGGIITQVFLHGDIDGAFEEAENQAKLAM